MDTRLAQLLKIANDLDSIGMLEEADGLTDAADALVRVTPQDVLAMPNASDIIAAAKDWVADCQWEEDPEYIDELPVERLLAGVDRHYAGGLTAFLKDSLFI